MVHTPITPNHLTGLRLMTGLAASFCLASGDPYWINSGCGLFVLSMFLDRADGELARLSGKTSIFGHRFDLWTDALCDSTILLGLGIGLRSGPFGEWALAMGIIAGMSSGIIFYKVLALDKRLGPGSVMFEAFAGFDPDDAIIIVPLSAALGFGHWILAAATLATPLAAVLVLRHLESIAKANVDASYDP
jgi:archaetidylinositol phosphate synthase